MLKQQKTLNKILLVAGIFALLVIGITTTIGNILISNNKIQAQKQPQLIEKTQSSIPHNAKGHESHQIVNFQNSSDGITYKGTVFFNSSKPIDIISYTETTGQQKNTNTTVKIWEVGDKKFIPKTLLKNATKGIVDFDGSGVLAHSTQSIPYRVTFTINATALNGAEGSISLGPLLKIFR
jgi:hypothetical protein